MATKFTPEQFNSGEVALFTEELEIAAHARNLTLIHNALDHFEAAALEAKGAAVAAVYDAFKTAVIEIATNILRHAYPPDVTTAPLSFRLALFSQRLEAIFHDQGIAFSPPTELAAPALDEIDDILDVPEGNFGLFLALQALDSLDYSRSPDGVNQWRLNKFLS